MMDIAMEETGRGGVKASSETCVFTASVCQNIKSAKRVRGRNPTWRAARGLGDRFSRAVRPDCGGKCM